MEPAIGTAAIDSPPPTRSTTTSPMSQSILTGPPGDSPPGDSPPSVGVDWAPMSQSIPPSFGASPAGTAAAASLPDAPGNPSSSSSSSSTARDGHADDRDLRDIILVIVAQEEITVFIPSDARERR